MSKPKHNNIKLNSFKQIKDIFFGMDEKGLRPCLVIPFHSQDLFDMVVETILNSRKELMTSGGKKTWTAIKLDLNLKDIEELEIKQTERKI